MAQHVALLRGINVGGHNKLPMKQLKPIFESLGAEDVWTYIQSGNVVFKASGAVAKTLDAAVTKKLKAELGLDVPIVVRTAKEFEAAAKRDPFGACTHEQAKLRSIGFCLKKPTAAAIKMLDPKRSPGDRFAVLGAQVYLNLKIGMSKTKLTNSYFDSALGTPTTFRNWRTITKLLERLAGD